PSSRIAGSRSTRRGTISRVPSPLMPSTTSTSSRSRGYSLARIDSRHRSMRRASSRHGTTTETKGRSGGGMPNVPGCSQAAGHAVFQGRAVHPDKLLREQPLVEVAHGVSSLDAAGATEHACEGGGDRLGVIVGAQLAPLDGREL